MFYHLLKMPCAIVYKTKFWGIPAYSFTFVFDVTHENPLSYNGLIGCCYAKQWDFLKPHCGLLVLVYDWLLSILLAADSLIIHFDHSCLQENIVFRYVVDESSLRYFIHVFVYVYVLLQIVRIT